MIKFIIFADSERKEYDIYCIGGADCRSGSWLYCAGGKDAHYA